VLIFASIINPNVEEGELNSENIVSLYDEFYNSVNSYDELNFVNAIDYLTGVQIFLPINQ